MDHAAWTWEEIERDWLGGGRLALTPEIIVAAFNSVTATFGRRWIEDTRESAGDQGTSPTLRIVSTGQGLETLKGVRRAERLIEKMRVHDASAYAELRALELIAGNTPGIEAQYEPDVVVSGRTRRADLRVAADGGEWVYVEVTRPNPANAQRQLNLAMAELTGVLTDVTGTYTAEVFLRRHTSAPELRGIRGLLIDVCGRRERAEFELADGLGVVYLNDAVPGQINLESRGEPACPRLGTAQFQGDSDGCARHIVVRVPYYDTRGSQFLATEASQLPEGCPGLIVIDVSAAGGGREWGQLLEGELKLGLYDQVSAICLVRTGQVGTPDGEALRMDARVVVNPTAQRSLPGWLLSLLKTSEQPS
jgi:hypothetical protein